MSMPAPTASSPASSQRKTVPTASSQQVHSAKQPPQRVHSEFTAQNSTRSEFTASSERKTITRARTRIKIKQYQISTKSIPDQYQINTRSISDRYQDQYQTNIKINAGSLSGLITVLNFKPVS
jgi:capsule polysaccharide export protein KpsE/RkpR